MASQEHQPNTSSEAGTPFSHRGLEERLPALEKELAGAGAPWAPGQPVPPVR